MKFLRTNCNRNAFLAANWCMKQKLYRGKMKSCKIIALTFSGKMENANSPNKKNPKTSTGPFAFSATVSEFPDLSEFPDFSEKLSSP